MSSVLPLTPEQQRVLRFMETMGQTSLIYWVKDEYPVTITADDFAASRPLAEIFAVKIALFEQGDAAQFVSRVPF